jgi:hypothetical protein
MPSGGGHTHALKREGVGKGAAARHDITQAATAHAAEFAGRGDWSARTLVWARSEAHAHVEAVGRTAALAAISAKVEGTWRGQLARALSLRGCSGRRGYDALQRRPRGGGRRRPTT